MGEVGCPEVSQHTVEVVIGLCPLSFLVLLGHPEQSILESKDFVAAQQMGIPNEHLTKWRKEEEGL
jgi:hypothetical protein